MRNLAIIRRGEARLARKRWPYYDVFGMAMHHGRDMSRPYKPIIMFIANPKKGSLTN